MNRDVRLAEGVTDAAPPAASVPDDLRPRRMFTAEQIRSALPSPAGSGGATCGSAADSAPAPLEPWCQIWHHRRRDFSGEDRTEGTKSPRSLTFAEACDLAEAHFGPARQGSGSHVAIYKMPWQREIQVTGSKAKEYQVKQLIKAIDKKKEDQIS